MAEPAQSAVPAQHAQVCLLGAFRKRPSGPARRGEASRSPPAVGLRFLLLPVQTREALFFIGNPPFPCGQHVIERVSADARSGKRGETLVRWVGVQAVLRGSSINRYTQRTRTQPQRARDRQPPQGMHGGHAVCAHAHSNPTRRALAAPDGLHPLLLLLEAGGGDPVHHVVPLHHAAVRLGLAGFDDLPLVARVIELEAVLAGTDRRASPRWAAGPAVGSALWGKPAYGFPWVFHLPDAEVLQWDDPAGLLVLQEESTDQPPFGCPGEPCTRSPYLLSCIQSNRGSCPSG